VVFFGSERHAFRYRFPPSAFELPELLPSGKYELRFPWKIFLIRDALITINYEEAVPQQFSAPRFPPWVVFLRQVFLAGSPTYTWPGALASGRGASSPFPFHFFPIFYPTFIDYIKLERMQFFVFFFVFLRAYFFKSFCPRVALPTCFRAAALYPP